LWDFKTGKLVRVLKGHNDPIHSLYFSTDGKHLATGDNWSFANRVRS